MSGQKDGRPNEDSHEDAYLKGFRKGHSSGLEDYGNTLREAYRGGVAIGAVATTIALASTIGIFLEVQHGIDKAIALRQEQKANDRMDVLAKKYNVNNLTQASQDAFWRLVQLRPEDVGIVTGTEVDSEQTGVWLQEDIATLNAELVNNGAASDEFDLARELIPSGMQQVLVAAGFKLTPVNPVHCDAGETPTYRPFDYSNHLPADFKVTYTGRGDRILRIPLGAMQTPAPVEDPDDAAISPTPLFLSTDLMAPLPFGVTSSSTPTKYQKYGCRVLPRGDLGARKKQVY